MRADTIALDRASVRSFDQAGHLRVALTPISKAAVNPYIGKEIAGGEALGLLPDKVYHLYRDPAELKAAVASFNGKPLMLMHRPQMAGDHEPQHVVGSVHDAQFDGTYMLAALEVWDQAAIDLIESGEQRQLSSGYFYTADMTPGVADGVRYDGVMRKITANHVALVEEGRAGPDVFVGDSMENVKEHSMAKQSTALTRKALLASGALRAYLAPKMAADHKMPDVRAMVKTATHANWAEQKPKIVAAVSRTTKGKLAADASLDDLVELLDSLDDEEVEEAVDAATVDPDAVPAASDDDALSTFLKGLGLSDEDVAKACEMAKPAPAADEFPPKDDKSKDDKDDKKGTAMDAKPVTKAAMDAAVAAAKAEARREAVAHMNAVHAAHEAVRPYVGEVMGMDSADDIYAYALTQMGVDFEGVPAAAYPKMLKMAPKPGEQKPTVAMDAAGLKSFADKFPGAARIKHI
jgi:hypothetical protein